MSGKKGRYIFNTFFLSDSSWTMMAWDSWPNGRSQGTK